MAEGRYFIQAEDKRSDPTQHALHALGENDIEITAHVYTLRIEAKAEAGEKELEGHAMCSEVVASVSAARLIDYFGGVESELAVFGVQPGHRYACGWSSQDRAAPEALVTIREGEYSTVRQFTIGPKSTPCRLLVNICDPSGAPWLADDAVSVLARAIRRVVAESGDGQKGPTFAAALAPGDYIVRVDPREHAPWCSDGWVFQPPRYGVGECTCEIRAGDDASVTVRLPDGGRLSLTLGVAKPIRDPRLARIEAWAHDDRCNESFALLQETKDNPCAIVTIEGRPNDSPRRLDFYAPDCIILIADRAIPTLTSLSETVIEAGAHVVHVEAAGFEPADAEVVIKNGATSALRIEFEPR